ncbi:hypothetical protein GQ43DRAFT_440422 [Delitschia confertaspora ATCC 74209]|uniref:Uncharacterized protein n=1 Tax=Delitschia confertaspora ATCC 74209 TaxID=1513339 RepID=A0A9P4MT27_9PLEO|nr:hypothetical protein GQ43DRAFT_440422 [Delitschia confertaspora ATCC 74209]
MIRRPDKAVMAKGKDSRSQSRSSASRKLKPASKIVDPTTPSPGSSKLPRRVATPATATSQLGAHTNAIGQLVDLPAKATSAESTSTASMKRLKSIIHQPTIRSPVLDKPLPSPPVARVVNPASPVKAEVTLIDASVKLPKSIPGTPQGREWQVITPKVVPISHQKSPEARAQGTKYNSMRNAPRRVRIFGTDLASNNPYSSEAFEKVRSYRPGFSMAFESPKSYLEPVSKPSRQRATSSNPTSSGPSDNALSPPGIHLPKGSTGSGKLGSNVNCIGIDSIILGDGVPVLKSTPSQVLTSCTGPEDSGRANLKDDQIPVLPTGQEFVIEQDGAEDSLVTPTRPSKGFRNAYLTKESRHDGSIQLVASRRSQTRPSQIPRQSAGPVTPRTISKLGGPSQYMSKVPASKTASPGPSNNNAVFPKPATLCAVTSISVSHQVNNMSVGRGKMQAATIKGPSTSPTKEPPSQSATKSSLKKSFRSLFHKRQNVDNVNTKTPAQNSQKGLATNQKRASLIGRLKAPGDVTGTTVVTGQGAMQSVFTVGASDTTAKKPTGSAEHIHQDQEKETVQFSSDSVDRLALLEAVHRVTEAMQAVKQAEISAQQAKQHAKEAELQTEMAKLVFDEILTVVGRDLGSIEGIRALLEQASRATFSSPRQ